MTEIVSAPNEVLGKVAEQFDFSKSHSLNALLKDMEKALLSASDPKGVGLAAPQIGKSVSIFIAKPTEKSKITVYINPQILDMGESKKLSKAKSASGGKVKKLEGCLSLPNIWGEVMRSPNVTLTYYDEKGKKITKKFSGFMATIVQHEVDHLNGILFPKRVLEQKGTLYKSHKDEKGQDEFEELEI
jgi:peptide deformylase